MKIKAPDLRKALATLKDAQPRRSTIPELFSTRIVASFGKLSVAATDLTAFASYEIACEGDLEGCCVPSRLLNDIALSSGDSTIEIDYDTKNKTNRLMIFYGQNRLQTAVLPFNAVPTVPTEDSKAVAVNTSDLAEAIESVRFAANPASKEIKETAIQIALNEKMLTVNATDRRLLASFRQPAICGVESCIFLADKALGLTSYLMQKEPSVTLSKSFITASNAFGSFSTKLLEGDYFPVDRVIEQNGTFLGLLSREPLLGSLKFIESLSEQSWASITLSFEKARLCVTFQGPQRNFETELPGAFEPSVVRVDAALLSRCLTALPDEPLNVSVLPNALRFQVGNLFASVALIT